jgi:hypothetical protein
MWRFILFAAVPFLVVPLVDSAVAQSTSQSAGCSEVKWTALSPRDPAYASAMDLAHQLTEHGFIVMCVAPSKMTDMFEGQEGAAVYKTNEGTFEALFAPKGQTFDGLQVIERYQRGRCLYSFWGVPKPRSASMTWDSDRPEYFIRHVNQFIVVRDKELAIRIEHAVGGS